MKHTQTLITALILTAVFALTAAGIAADQSKTDSPIPPLVTLKKSLKVTSRYLVFPTVFIPKVKSSVNVSMDGKPLFNNPGTLSTRGQFLWTNLDVSEFAGKEMTISAGVREDDQEAMDAVHFSDTIEGHPDLYQEKLRSQFHFSYRTGVMGDPTAMIYYPPKKEWHLFTIANPFNGREICWGHAVSKDLVHWEERAPIFHHPNLIFNGVGFIDTENCLNLNTNSHQAMVLLTPIMGRQDGNVSMKVSIDGGFVFKDMNDLRAELKREDLPKNPIVPGGGDAPRIWRNPVARKYFMTHCLWGHSDKENPLISLQYTSSDLKSWDRVDNFPLLIHANFKGEGDANDVVEIPVDGDANKKVVFVNCGRNGYALGKFSKTGLDNLQGEPLSPKDTLKDGHDGYPNIFANAPNGRVVAMGHPNNVGIVSTFAGFHTLSFPLELSVRTTPSGLRLFRNPVAEIATLHGQMHSYKDLTINANTLTPLVEPKGDLFHILIEAQVPSGVKLELLVDGKKLPVSPEKLFNGEAANPDKYPTLKAEFLVDRTCYEAFYQDGQFFAARGDILNSQRKPGTLPLSLYAFGGPVKIINMTVCELKSIWNNNNVSIKTMGLNSASQLLPQPDRSGDESISTNVSWVNIVNDQNRME